MEPIDTHLEYIVDSPKFKTERPFAVHVGDHQLDKYQPEDPQLNTIDLKEEPTKIYDLRSLNDVSLERYGFETYSREFTPFSLDHATEDQVEIYQTETEEFLKEVLSAEKVVCYDYRLRRNGPSFVPGEKLNMNDPLLLDLPPRGAHNGISPQKLGPQLIKTVLGATNQLQYLNSKYRIRIVNTWRPLVDKLDDQPLAVCDFRTLKLDNMIAADRIYVSMRTQVYYLKHDPAQRWYWFSHQTPKETMVMLMYDTKPRPGHANFCPHVSFHNPKAAKDAPPRESVETRNIVITLASESD
ncbi:hypothetical protein CEP52_015360 [Fusarium oligoseptatum]|uniref:Methyltransferase n=1 Tax=Fusarium oligoseptatum TaxID=2604345 RepID=A0A428SDX6_9HYPO|nr:hypothetical protein CEP52_015360 [Fusarium oligoseptatum]